MLRCFDDALFGHLDNYVSSSVSRSAVVAAADADKDGALACAELAPVIRFYASCPSSTSTTRGSRPRWTRSWPAHEPRLLLLQLQQLLLCSLYSPWGDQIKTCSFLSLASC